MRLKRLLSLLAVGVVFSSGWFLANQSGQSISVAHAQSKVFHVSGGAIPGTLTVPTPSEGGSIATTSVLIDTLVIANTDSSSHTVTVQDCQDTPFVLFTAYPVAATTTWVVPLNGTRFEGCFKWTASSTTVMGTVVGRR